MVAAKCEMKNKRKKHIEPAHVILIVTPQPSPLPIPRPIHCLACRGFKYEREIVKKNIITQPFGDFTLHVIAERCRVTNSI